MKRHTVYGLRLKGDKEVRYIGQTNGAIETRLQLHFTNAAGLERSNKRLCAWLNENGRKVEIFKIAYAETRADALGIERAIIALCLRLEQRIFNQRGLPTSLRLVA